MLPQAKTLFCARPKELRSFDLQPRHNLTNIAKARPNTKLARQRVGEDLCGNDIEQWREKLVNPGRCGGLLIQAARASVLHNQHTSTVASQLAGQRNRRVA